jgi:hypothetical protein
MVQPFRVRDGDDPGRDQGGWSETGDIDIPGVLTVDTVRGSSDGPPSAGTVTFESMVSFLAAAAFVATVLELEGAADTDAVLRARVTDDPDPRFSIDASGRMGWGDGDGDADAELFREAAGTLRTDAYVVVGSGQANADWTVWGGTPDALTLGTAGGGLAIQEGDNARMGSATLAAGTVTVPNTSVTADSRIFLTCQAPGGTPGFLRVSARSAGTSFTITSSSGTDTSTVAWLIVEPA